jgi:hypothetical protein
MRLLKKERDALIDLLNEGAEGPAELADDCAKTLDGLRGDRNYHYALVQHVVGFHVIGPFATAGQAEKAGAKHPAAERCWVIQGFSAEGIDRLIREADTPAAPTGDYVIVNEDARAFRNGWKGNRRDREKFL